MNIKRPPPSATHGSIVIVGLIVFLLSLFLMKFFRLFEDPVQSALFIIGITALVIFSVEFVFFKTYKRSSTGLNFQTSDPSWRRTAVKFVGLLGSMVFIGILYWLFPEYHGDFYTQYYTLLEQILPWILMAAIPYIYFVDRYQIDPKDSYFYMGQILLFNF